MNVACLRYDQHFGRAERVALDGSRRTDRIPRGGLDRDVMTSIKAS